ncbi:ATP-binding protein [Streptomyces sp. NPDC047022]|uniref:ATP-binding protein n=1 Tax=Streptomyces sp. NPDC047022 TaxID=3155737 RepID=UPI003402CCE1
MDPNTTGPEEYGHDGAGETPRQRPPRDTVTPDFGHPAPAKARTVQLVSGDLLLTVNPVDGSEIEVCPPGRRPAPPAKRTPEERAELARAARPPVPPGPAQRALPLLERQEERERLVRLLARGRSVRLTGPSGSGRSALLDVVAEDCSDLAPDGVVRLSGYRRSATDLLYDLFAAVFKAPLHRPAQEELAQHLRETGAVVVLDDLEFGGSGLDELLDATPECAFLLSATPDVPAPSADAQVEEVLLGGLDRAAGLDLLERAIDRDLTEDEANWAGDLWFESEGLPLRFVQAGALLRERDRRRADEDAVDEYGVFQDLPSAGLPAVPDREATPAYDGGDDGHDVPLPSLAEAAAPAPLLASRLSASAREALKFAVALGGEVPHQTHLPALVDDTHADAALAELVGSALVSPVGSRYRLAAGVLAQLEAAGYETGAEEYAFKAAQHYAWWAAHPSVTAERVCAEADAVLATLTVLLPLTTRPAEDEESLAALLARQAAPAFAAGLDWGAWERALRSGAEASRLSGEVVEQAYFHHELGILALCGGRPERARAELEASIGLRGALADKRGTVAGRRALALVADRTGATPPVGTAAAAQEAQDPRPEESTPPSGFGFSVPVGDTATLITRSVAAEPARVGGVMKGARRNLVAAGAGAVLVAVLGTVVALGMTSDNSDNPSENVQVGPSASQGPGDDSLGANTAPKPDKGGNTGGPGATTTPSPTAPGTDGTSGAPTASSSAGHPSGEPTGRKDSTPPKPPSHTASTPPASSSPSGSPSSSPSGAPSGSSSPSSSGAPSTAPSKSTDSASGRGSLI